MICPEYENVNNFLKSKNICLPPNNTWLQCCINWYKCYVEVREAYKSLHEYVLIQWLLADLQDVQHSSLPVCSSIGKTKLNGKYCVQINWMRDIAQSNYTQLQSTQNIKQSESNDYVSADDPKKQSWEPNPKRVLLLEITDGVTTFKAMEYSSIPKLDDTFLPGMKVLLLGPIECRNGILFLKNENITILGGEVEHLYLLNCKENLLSRCLNIPVNNGEQDAVRGSFQNSNNTWTNNSHCGQIQTNLDPSHRPDQRGCLNISPVLSNAEQVPDSTSTIEHNMYAEDMMMSDEDDDFLHQLPDEVLNHAHNLSPVISEGSFPHDSTKTPERHKNCNERPAVQRTTTFNKPLIVEPKLFPSLEDLHCDKQQNTCQNNLANKSLLGDSMSEHCPKEQNQSSLLPETSSSSRNNSLSYPSTSHAIGLTNKSTPGHSVQLNQVQECVESIIVEDEHPCQKTVKAKLESITKIKIKSSEWQCSANILADGQSLNVSFSNKVLENIFGISASEVEVLREEMQNNNSLKDKVNKILKTGQAKLKALHCSMTIEYLSEVCTPEVIAINVT